VLLVRNRYRSLLGVFLSICMASCGGAAATPNAKASPSTGVQHASLTVGGATRTYRLYIPPSLDSNQRRLVVGLTGCPSKGDDMAQATHLDDLAAASKFVIVYPDPVDGCWNSSSCCGAAEDTSFISSLIDRLTSSLRIDKARVFAAGFSSGAFMAYTLACMQTSRFAAIASVAGTLDIQDCKPSRPISVVAMHGTKDSSVIYEAGVTAVQRWVTLDGCTGDPTRSTSGITTTSIWSRCQRGTMVRFDSVAGGHHQWFGSTFDPVPGEPDSNAVILDFFSKVSAPAA